MATPITHRLIQPEDANCNIYGKVAKSSFPRAAQHRQTIQCNVFCNVQAPVFYLILPAFYLPRLFFHKHEYVQMLPRLEGISVTNHVTKLIPLT